MIIEPGDVVYVRVKPNVPGGRRSRSGLLFEEATELAIQAAGGPGVSELSQRPPPVEFPQVSPKDMAAILADDALIVSDRPSMDLAPEERIRLNEELAACREQLDVLSAENVELRAQIERMRSDVERAPDASPTSDWGDK